MDKYISSLEDKCESLGKYVFIFIHKPFWAVGGAYQIFSVMLTICKALLEMVLDQVCTSRASK